MKICQACNRPFAGSEWRCPECGSSPKVESGFLAFAPELAEQGGFASDVSELLASAEARNFWFRSRNQLIIWALGRYFPAARSVLEIGCGTGFVLSGLEAHFPGIRLAGSEIKIPGLAYAAQRVKSATLFQVDARRIPFVEEFDVVGAFDVLEHIQEDELVLSQINQAVVPGGGIILTVPQHRFLWSQQDEYACHVRRYEAENLKQKVRRAGFVVDRVTSFVSLLLPLMFLSRWRKRKAVEKFDPLSELRIGRFANSLMETTLDIERVLIRLGCSVPVGGSLLLIARKV